ncbi:8-oxo-dGTP diphosphatase [Catenuloplanes nepalensis]|uniref:8-oxo-dGTP diphosphatase n=1 Tax=Catenuloplanes nepalensis TaxID=587533 RepID=A0ABT9MV93_9ACTN|nr:NUDIX domain-containing protein [Catenuloplanes nepalensis]MDP9795153.1 8-oxo-dGTP diphosphatase [Catenuloplanes nepalensis]
MGVSDYIAGLRARIGHDLLMLPSASAVVVNDAGELLLERRSDDGRWSIPSGVIDPGEQPAEAAVREVLEETGVRVTVERLAGVAMHPTRYPNGDECQYLNLWFLCRPVPGEDAARVADDESLEVGWFAQDVLPPLNDYERLRIETTMRGSETAWFAPAGERLAALGFD